MKLALFNKDENIQLYMQPFPWAEIFTLLDDTEICAVEFLVLGVRRNNIIHVNRSGSSCSDELFSLQEDVKLSHVRDLVEGLEANVYEYKLRIGELTIDHTVNGDAVFESDKARIYQLSNDLKIPTYLLEQCHKKLISVDESGKVKTLAEFNSYTELFDHLYDELMEVINAPGFNFND